MATHEVDISESPSGTYKTVRTALKDAGVEFSYDKPVFSFDTDDAALVEHIASLAGTTKPEPEEAAPSPPRTAPKAPASPVGPWRVTGLSIRGGAISYLVEADEAPSAESVSEGFKSCTVSAADGSIVSSWP